MILITSQMTGEVRERIMISVKGRHAVTDGELKLSRVQMKRLLT